MTPAMAQRVMQRPPLVAGVGRLLGLGDTEQKALVQGELPTWAIATIALGAGVAAGAYVQKRWRVMR